MADHTRTQDNPNASTDKSSADTKGQNRTPNEQPDRGKTDNASSTGDKSGSDTPRAEATADGGQSSAMQDKPKADAIPATGTSSDSKRS